MFKMNVLLVTVFQNVLQILVFLEFQNVTFIIVAYLADSSLTTGY